MLPVVDLATYTEPTPGAFLAAVQTEMEHFDAGQAAELRKDLDAWAREVAADMQRLREDVERDGASNIGTLIRKLTELQTSVEESLHGVPSSLKRYQALQREYAGKTDAGPEARSLIQKLNASIARLKAALRAGQSVAQAYEECRNALVLHRFMTPDPRSEYRQEHEEIAQDWLVVSEPSLARVWSD